MQVEGVLYIVLPSQLVVLLRHCSEVGGACSEYGQMFSTLPRVFFEVLVHEFSTLITKDTQRLGSGKGLELLT